MHGQGRVRAQSAAERGEVDGQSEQRTLPVTTFSSTWPITRPVGLPGGLAVAPVSACLASFRARFARRGTSDEPAQSSRTFEPQGTNLQLTGGAAIVAPVSAFPDGVPGNALVVLPINKPSDELMEILKQGAVAVNAEQMWKLLGFNGPAVQVQDDQGRPIAIGLEDLLAGLEKHWQSSRTISTAAGSTRRSCSSTSAGPRAEQVLSKIVAKGGAGDDWLALGIAQLSQEKLDKAEGTLKGAQNLMKDNPYPSLHLAKLFQGKKEQDEGACEFVEQGDRHRSGLHRRVGVPLPVPEASGRRGDGAVRERAARSAPRQERPRPRTSRVQGFYANDEATRDKAIGFAKKAVAKAPDDPLALLCLSALYGQKGDLDSVVEALQPHEAQMSRDVRLANNYFEALFQSRQIEKVTKLLNALAGSPNKEVKQFAIERSRDGRAVSSSSSSRNSRGLRASVAEAGYHPER